MNRLRNIDSFAGRLAERRRRGAGINAVAAYVHAVIISSARNCNHFRLRFDHADLPTLLTSDEYSALAELQRRYAATWTQNQRNKISARKKSEITNTRENQRKDEAATRKRLLGQGAVSIGEVARRLGTSVHQVRKLQTIGRLPAAGCVPIQHSRGKPVYLWLPGTIIRYLTDVIAEKSQNHVTQL